MPESSRPCYYQPPKALAHRRPSAWRRFWSGFRVDVAYLAARAGLRNPLAPACREDLLLAAEVRVCWLAGRAGRGQFSIVGALAAEDAPPFFSPVGAEAWRFLRATNLQLFETAREGVRRRMADKANGPGGYLIPNEYVAELLQVHARGQASGTATVRVELFREDPSP